MQGEHHRSTSLLGCASFMADTYLELDMRPASPAAPGQAATSGLCTEIWLVFF